MAALQMFFFAWLLYLIGAVIPLVTYMSKRLANKPLPAPEPWALIAPFMIWCFFMVMNLVPKSLSNLVETLILGAVISVLYLCRLLFGHPIKEPSRLYLAACCVAAVFVYFFVPALPE